MQGHHRPYQGYPYVTNIVTDAPSIRPEDANRWANLPRRLLVPARETPRTEVAAGGSAMQSTNPAPALDNLPSKRDPDPVVYIDLPEDDGSEVTQSLQIEEDTRSDFVQDTIMFDPFENRRIEVGKRTEGPGSSRSSTSEVSSTGQVSMHRPGRYPEPQVHRSPLPSNTLDLSPTAASSSTLPTNTFRAVESKSSGLPAFLANETYVYGGDASLASPVSGGAFPEPPPAYSESDTLGRPRGTPQGASAHPQIPQSPQVQHPPRTTVFTTLDTYNATDQRKFLTCHHCGHQGHTLVIKEIGFITHLIALLCLLIFLPLLIIVYCTDIFKHKNHYCSTCNKLIGYFSPLGEKFIYNY